MFLTPEQIVKLTDRRRRAAQIRQLRYMGIDHKVRMDGSIAVLEAHVNKVFGGDAEKPLKVKPRVEPNWSGVC